MKSMAAKKYVVWNQLIILLKFLNNNFTAC